MTNTPQPVRTARLSLRPLTADDAPALAAWRSDPEVARFCGWDAPYPVESARRLLTLLTDAEPGTPGEWFAFGVVRRQDDVVIGDCSACPDADDPRTVEIGVTLAREHQGHGYATEILQEVLADVFADRSWVLGAEAEPVHRVTASCDARDLRAARLLERLGMRREGVFVESEWFKGEWTSGSVYALLRREWDERRAPVR